MISLFMVSILVDCGEGCNKKDHDDDPLIDRFVSGEGHGDILSQVGGWDQVPIYFFYFVAFISRV